MTIDSATSDVDHVALFSDERLALLELPESLKSNDWSFPTACPGWSVLDLACRLVGDDLGLQAHQRDAHAGPHPPPRASDETVFARWLDATQDAWVQSGQR
jgi:hypothetical protein